MDIKQQISALVQGKMHDSGHFLVEIRTLPGKIAVFIDHPATGVKLEDCIGLSKYLQLELESSGIFEKNELEVSSPGMDEPLKVLPQYIKRKGQRVNVITFDGLKHQGILTDASEAGIEMEESREKKINGKKELVTTHHRFSFAQIKETKINYSIDKLLK